MKILLSSYYLDLSGTPTYTLVLYDELVSRGHQVQVYSPKGGTLSQRMAAVSNLDLLQKPDVIIAHQNVCAEQMREKFPGVPMIFSAHGVLPSMEQPPACHVERYTAINEDVRDNLIKQGCRPVEIVRDFVDIHKFHPTRPLNKNLQKVLYISNFRKGETYEIIKKACSILGVELKAVGAPYGRCHDVAKEINEHDLVISVARGLLEGMACGRPVISFSQMRGDGYLTREMYFESRTRNFAGEKCRYTFTPDILANEMARYSPKDGAENRGLILDYHNHIWGTDKIMQEVYML